MSLYVDIEKRLGNFHLQAKFDTDSGIMGLLGASGCGKSYTLKCIAGIERPDRGRIELDGNVLFDSEKGIDLKPQQRQVGYLFQNYALFPNMTVRQNILCGLHREKDRAKKEKAVEDVLKLFQLTGLEKHRPAQLSGGQQQRVALARILVNQPKLLMLDEPFSALDTFLRERLQIEMLAVLKDYGRPVLMVTHSRDEAYHMCDRIAVMDQGTLFAPRPTKEVFADPRSRCAAILTGCKNIAGCEKTGEHEVFVPEWGVTLTASQPVPDGVRYAAVRAHYFNPREKANAYPIQLVSEMEEPFEWVVEFRYAAQKPDSATIWWRMPKEKHQLEMPEALGTAPVNVLLLTQ